MEFRNLKKQYSVMQQEIDDAVCRIMKSASFISGKPVTELEEQLASYVGKKYCISCANGTDALLLALMAWGIGKNDAVFVPDFTFFSSGEVVPIVGAIPVFVDIDPDTYNISPQKLEDAIKETLKQGRLTPKVIVAVDLFGLPADFAKIREIASKYNLLILEDGAQGFGGNIEGKRACSFGDISTTSFFPAKPLGCCGDGGALFTDDSEWAELIRSLAVHGKGANKYDNIRIGMNSRLDTIQAAILQIKLKYFASQELDMVNAAAGWYRDKIKTKDVILPLVKEGYLSSWAQYTIRLGNEKDREKLQEKLKENGIPSMIYYKKPMHAQKAFGAYKTYQVDECMAAECACRQVLSLPIGPYAEEAEVDKVCKTINNAV